jgi:two-component sensor histidine kinase
VYQTNEKSNGDVDTGEPGIRPPSNHRRKTMTPRHSAFTIGASPGAICAIHADRLLHQPLGSAAMRGIHMALPRSASLEQALSVLLHEVTPERGVRLRIFIEGNRQALRPAIQDQLFMIGREAVVNALRHSKATKIEVEVQYLRCSVRMLVRDNGCGINPDVAQKESDSYSGLREMRGRAETIGAQFGIWSRPGAGTEVRISIPSNAAIAQE